MKPSELCLVLNGKDLAADIELVDRCRDLIDLVEVRADFLDPSELAALDRFPGLLGKPAILTVRRIVDGGRFAGTEAERSAVYRRALTGPWAFVDLETDWSDRSLEAAVHENGIRIIRSFHDFTGVPADLAARIAAVQPEEIPKAAVLPRTTAETLRLFEACAALSEREKIILGMGDHGLASRVLAAKIGSRISYCSLPPAQGRLDPETMNSLYRFRQLGPDTRVFGIIGNPVGHSFSPRIHNRSFRELEIDAVYVPFLVDDPAAFLGIARLLGLDGFSVTLPHKSAIIPLLDETDELVKTVGACNTVIRRGDRFIGYNTDVQGFIEPLYKYFPPERLSSVGATVIGAGGAARAVVQALTAAGVRVLILNRTADRAESLAREFGCAAGPLTTEGFSHIDDHRDIIIQTTQVGMSPEPDADPLTGYAFAGTELVYDLIYTPRLTRALQRALEKRCKVLNGEEMFMAQAHEQFKLFTGKESTFRHNYIADFGVPVT